MTSVILTTGFQDILGKLVPECQSILHFAAARDERGSGSDSWNSRKWKAFTSPYTIYVGQFFYCHPSSNVKALKAFI